jgi:hypothetical protein
LRSIAMLIVVASTSRLFQSNSAVAVSGLLLLQTLWDY